MTTRADSQHACPYVLERRVVIGRTSLHNRSLDFPRRSRPCRSTWPPRCRSRAAPQQPPSKASWRLSCLKPLARRCSATVSELARTTRRACRLVGNAIGNQPPDDGGSCSAVNGPLRDLFAYDTACTLRPSQPRGGRPRLARRGVRAHVSAPVPLYLPHRVNPLRTVLPSPVWPPARSGTDRSASRQCRCDCRGFAHCSSQRFRLFHSTSICASAWATLWFQRRGGRGMLAIPGARDERLQAQWAISRGDIRNAHAKPHNWS